MDEDDVINEFYATFGQFANDAHLEVAHLLSKTPTEIPIDWRDTGDDIDKEAFTVNCLLTGDDAAFALRAHLDKSVNKEQTKRIMRVIAENHDVSTATYSHTDNVKQYIGIVNDVIGLSAEKFVLPRQSYTATPRPLNTMSRLVIANEKNYARGGKK